MPTALPGVARKAAFTLTVSAVFLTAACTGRSGSGATDDPSRDTTITFWHAWSAPNEVKAVESLVAGFENAHPNIHVKVVGTMTDDKINQALRAGGDRAPDVISLVHHQQRGQVLLLGCPGGSEPVLREVRDRPREDVPEADERVHPVRRQPLYGAAAR